jgi:hypothetical protein
MHASSSWLSSNSDCTLSASKKFMIIKSKDFKLSWKKAIFNLRSYKMSNLNKLVKVLRLILHRRMPKYLHLNDWYRLRSSSMPRRSNIQIYSGTRLNRTCTIMQCRSQSTWQRSILWTTPRSGQQTRPIFSRMLRLAICREDQAQRGLIELNRLLNSDRNNRIYCSKLWRVVCKVKIRNSRQPAQPKHSNRTRTWNPRNRGSTATTSQC